MVSVIIVYLHSGRQRLWLEKARPDSLAGVRRGWARLFLLGWLAGKRVLQSEETNGHIPGGIAHDARHPKCWLTHNSSPGIEYVQGDSWFPYLHAVHV